MRAIKRASTGSSKEHFASFMFSVSRPDHWIVLIGGMARNKVVVDTLLCEGEVAMLKKQDCLE